MAGDTCYHHFIMKKFLVYVSLFAVWFILNLVAITYGTSELPMHQGYVGDEMSPINGALHILKEKSLLAVKDTKVLYYGPVFATLAVPPVLMDFGIKLLTGTVADAEGYKNHILFDWGGIIFWARALSTVFGFLCLVGVHKLFSTKTINPSNNLGLKWLAICSIAFNYYFFEYNHFFKHWVYVIAFIIWNLYFIIRILELKDNKENKKRYAYFVYSAFISLCVFGISYFSVIYLVMWAPVILYWLIRKDISSLRHFCVWGLSIIIGAAFIVKWHPYAFFRLLNKQGVFNPLLNAEPSWLYYFKLIFINHVTLIIAGMLLLFYCFRHRLLDTYNKLVAYSLSLTMLVNYAAFSIEPRAEGRYMLPTIVLGILLLYMLLCKIDYTSVGKQKKRLVKCVGVLISVYFLFHIVHIVKWNIVYSKGHPEITFIEILKKEYENNPQAKFLIVSDYIMGTVHTKDAYYDYAAQTDKLKYNLYQELISRDPHPHVTRLPIYYYFPDNLYFKKEEAPRFFLNPDIDLSTIPQDFTHVYIERVKRIEPNQFDFFDGNILRLWNFDRDYIRFERLR